MLKISAINNHLIEIIYEGIDNALLNVFVSIFFSIL